MTETASDLVRKLSGDWYNQHGSELRLEVAASGRIQGTFRSHRGLATPSDACEVTGYAAGDLLVFAANFAAFDSLTAWTGHYVNEGAGGRIQACWHMAVALPPGGDVRDLWKGVWTGQDEFRRAPFATPDLESRLLGSHPLTSLLP